tara:strand:+ start:64 stop:639 length:576 start_codon:yes stop_codon:yes gene_type:complete
MLMKAKTRNITLIVIGVLAIVGITSFILIKKMKKKPNNILLLGGLDYRSGDKKIDEQVELVKKGSELETKGFRYNNSQGIIKEILESKKPMYVILFSKGGEYSNEIAQAMESKKIPLSYLYIVEPYSKSSKTAQSIKEAVSLGVPNKNVVVGNSISVGKGVVDNATTTPNCSPSHWCALEMVGKIIIQPKK